MKYIVQLYIVLCLIVGTAQAQDAIDTQILDSEGVALALGLKHAIRIDDNTQIEIYKQANGDIYFFKPIPFVHHSDLKNSINRKIDSIEDESEEVEIKIPITFMTRAIWDLIEYSLENKFGSKPTFTAFPRHFLFVYAPTSNGVSQIIFSTPPVESWSTEMSIGRAPIPTLNSKVTGYFRGNKSQLEYLADHLDKIYAHIVVKGKGFSEFSAQATAAGFVRSSSFTSLFGDAAEERERQLISKTSGGSFGLNIGNGVVHAGGAEAGVKVKDDVKRWISRNLIADSIQNYSTKLRANTYCSGLTEAVCEKRLSDARSDIQTLVLSGINSIEASFQKADDDQNKFFIAIQGEVTNNYVTVGDEIATAPKIESESGGEKDKLGISEAIKWKRDPQKRWVPTSVSLSAMNKLEIQREVELDVANIIATGDKTQLIISTSNNMPEDMGAWMKMELLSNAQTAVTGYVQAADSAWNGAWSRMALPPGRLIQPNGELLTKVGWNMAQAYSAIQNLKSQLKSTPGLDRSVVDKYNILVQQYRNQRQAFVARAGNVASRVNEWCLYLFYHSIPDNYSVLDEVNNDCPNVMNRTGRSVYETPMIIGIQQAINDFLSTFPAADTLAL